MSLTPYYDRDGITLYCGDCREILPQLGTFDLLLTDPPYGIDYKAGDSSQLGIQKFERIHGDAEEFNPEFILAFPDVICFGANNYTHGLPRGEGQFYCWDKVCTNGMKVRIAECEYLWHKNGTKPRVFRHLWSGAYRASEAGQRSQHPTQKPVALMQWCLGLVPNAQTIIDPFAGSGTTLLAARLEGRQCVGIEINEEYCRIAAERLRQSVFDFSDECELAEAAK
jgi:DNA modification methylase